MKDCGGDPGTCHKAGHGHEAETLALNAAFDVDNLAAAVMRGTVLANVLEALCQAPLTREELQLGPGLDYALGESLATLQELFFILERDPAPGEPVYEATNLGRVVNQAVQARRNAYNLHLRETLRRHRANM